MVNLQNLKKAVIGKMNTLRQLCFYFLMPAKLVRNMREISFWYF